MAWVDISGTEVYYKDSYGSYPSVEATAVCLQYDDSSETPESVKVRFKYYRTDGESGNLFDSMYILYNPDSADRILFQLKGYTKNTTANWPYYSESFTISKNYSSKTFSLKKYWICNYGSGSSTTTANSVYSVFDSTRSSLRCIVSSSTFAVSNTTITAVGKGTITITDHKNNTFSVAGTKGKDGENNPASGPVISWGYSTKYENSAAVSKKGLDIVTSTSDARTVYAKCVTKAAFGSDTTATTTLAVKQYVAPGNPGKPIISYDKSRLTIKEPWTYTWAAAAATNSSSPVKGYRVRVYKNGEIITGLAYDKTTNTLSKGTETNQWVDTDMPSTTVSFDPVKLGFKAGDKVKLSVFAYSRNALNQISWTAGGTSYSLFNSTQIYSNELTVQNAGVVHTNVKGTWKEGQVYVNVKGTWKEAESVHTNVGGTWKEAQ